MKPKELLTLGILAAAASFFLDSYAAKMAVAAKSRYLDYLMGWMTNLNTLIVVLVIMTALFLWEERKSKWIKPLLLSFAATAVAVTMLKLLVARPRPIEYEAIMLAVYSFPSMHAALAFSVVPVLDREFKKLQAFWLAFAVLIATSRVYLGVHYFSDVVAGAFIGYAAGKSFVWMQHKKKLSGLPWKMK